MSGKFFEEGDDMGGHSHWAGIKHKKAITDAKKGKVYTKLIREITIAAKLGGGDLASNARLRKAADDAKAVNMPLDNVKRAIMKGTGQLPGAMFEEVVYEGYGPGGIAIMVEVATDNKNRTVAEVRHLFTKHGGAMGENGSVGWMFDRKGVIEVDKNAYPEDKIMEAALEAGADDIQNPEGSEYYDVYTTPAAFEAVKAALEAKKLPIENAEVTMIASTEVKIETVKDAEQILKLMDALEEHDDTKNVHSNFDIPKELLEKLPQ